MQALILFSKIFAVGILLCIGAAMLGGMIAGSVAERRDRKAETVYKTTGDSANG